jgi:hypothetical protein
VGYVDSDLLVLIEVVVKLGAQGAWKEVAAWSKSMDSESNSPMMETRKGPSDDREPSSGLHGPIWTGCHPA